MSTADCRITLWPQVILAWPESTDMGFTPPQAGKHGDTSSNTVLHPWSELLSLRVTSPTNTTQSTTSWKTALHALTTHIYDLSVCASLPLTNTFFFIGTLSKSLHFVGVIRSLQFNNHKMFLEPLHNCYVHTQLLFIRRWPTVQFLTLKYFFCFSQQFDLNQQFLCLLTRQVVYHLILDGAFIQMDPNRTNYTHHIP